MVKLDIEQAKRKYLEAKRAYYAGRPIMSDVSFDKLEDWLKSHAPEWEALKQTGVSPKDDKIGRKTEVKLAQFMPSLNKLYPEEVNDWFFKYPRYRWAYMAKLDGCSVLLEYNRGVPVSLTTRGDGEYGKDISYFLPHLAVPQKIDDKRHIFLRCEAILKRADFKKYQEEFSASRNMVAGLLNRRDLHSALKDVHFVVLGIYGRKILQGLKHAFDLGFETVYCAADEPRSQAKYYEIVRQGQFDADGVVICNPDWVYHYDSAEKPKTDIVAYKENVEFKDTTVRSVQYQTSAVGRLIPVIEVDPVVLSGAKVTYSTSHNAKWMIDRQIGVGAKVRLTRSGDVIPKIIDVLSPGVVVYPSVPYKQVGVHFVALERSADQSVKMLLKFCTTLGVDFIGEQTAMMLYQMGAVNISKLIRLIHHKKFKPALQRRLGDVQGAKVYDALHKIVDTAYPEAQLMLASCAFDTGVGAKRLQSLQEQDFNLMELCKWDQDKIEQSILSPGIGETTAQFIAEGLKAFQKFWEMNAHLLQTPIPYVKKVLVQGKLSGVYVSFTGYRSKEQAELIEQNGGTVIDFGKKTTVLLYSPSGKESSKVAKAGDRAMTFSQFAKKFGLD